MIQFDIEAIRAEVRAMDYVRGTPAEVAQWREDNEDSIHNHFIDDIVFTPNELALFDMFLDEAVPPELCTQITLKLIGHPDAPTGPYAAMLSGLAPAAGVAR